MTEPNRIQHDYPLFCKITVVEQTEKGVMTNKQTQQQYNVRGTSLWHCPSAFPDVRGLYGSLAHISTYPAFFLQIQSHYQF